VTVATYIRQPGLERLWQAARRTWERNGGLRGAARVANLDEAEAFAVDGLLPGRVPRRAGAAFSVPLARLDERVRTAGLASSLQALLEELGGPLRDRRGERQEAADARNELWAAADAHPIARSEEWVRAWLLALRSSGALARTARGEERETLMRCLDVAQTLPRRGVELSRLASELTGDPHAFDYGTPLGGLLGSALAAKRNLGRPASAAEWRARWSEQGVLCDSLSCSVLTFALLPTDHSGLAKSLRLRAELGEPDVLTLRMLVRTPMVFAPETVYVCENPAVVSAAAEALGPASRPLICTGGWPNTAVATLLGALAAVGCHLRYQGDFDWEGRRIARHVAKNHRAVGWRADPVTYENAAARRDGGAPALDRHRGVPTDGEELHVAMERRGVAVYEEDIVEQLIEDLRRP
jgi:uncharacterized protein (TIGR02679 family)